MLLNSISAIGKYPPSAPRSLNFADSGSGQSYGTYPNGGLNGCLAVNATTPANYGRDLALTGYSLALKDASSGSTIATANPSVSTFESSGYLFTGLDITKSYNVTVAASNSAGAGATVQNISSVKPTTAPQINASAPVVTGYTTSSVTFTFTAWSATSSSPTGGSANTPSNGGAAISSYNITLFYTTSGTGTINANGITGTSPITLTGLSFTKGHVYQVVMAAANANGVSGNGSPSASFTPNP